MYRIVALLPCLLCDGWRAQTSGRQQRHRSLDGRQSLSSTVEKIHAHIEVDFSNVLRSLLLNINAQTGFKYHRNAIRNSATSRSSSRTLPFWDSKSRGRLPIMNEQSQYLEDLHKSFTHLQECFKEETSLPPGLAEIASNAYVAPSPIEGLGLFASRDLKKGTVVAFYPGHAIGLDSNKALLITDGHAEYWDSPQYNKASHRSQIMQSSVMEIAPGAYIDPNLQRVDLPGWTLHRANDAGCLDGTAPDEIMLYLSTVLTYSNIRTVPFGDAEAVTAGVTIRDVRKDEELLTFYGPDYWVEQKGKSIPESAYTVIVANYLKAVVGDFRAMDEALAEKYKAEIELCKDLSGRIA